MLSVWEAIKNRRSIRKYASDDVPNEIILQLLEAARLAPSGANRQPWQLVIVTDQERKRGLVPICKDQKFIADCSAFIAGVDISVDKVHKTGKGAVVVVKYPELEIVEVN
jgi:nitroreductase